MFDSEEGSSPRDADDMPGAAAAGAQLRPSSSDASSMPGTCSVGSGALSPFAEDSATAFEGGACHVNVHGMMVWARPPPPCQTLACHLLAPPHLLCCAPR